MANNNKKINEKYAKDESLAYFRLIMATRIILYTILIVATSALFAYLIINALF